MNIVNFLKNLVNSKFGRKDLTDKLGAIAQKLNEVVLPSLENVSTNPALANPQSSYAKGFIDAFLKLLPSNMRIRSKAPTFPIINQSLENIGRLVTLLTDVVGKELPEQIYIEGITYQRAAILRLIELMDFTVDYASRQLAYFTASEVNALTKKEGLPFTKAEETLIISQQSAYFKAIELFYRDPKNLMEHIHAIPEVLVDIHTKIPQVSNDLDPLKLNLIPLLSPFLLFLGERKVDWEYERYERAKRERKTIVLNIEMLEQANRGQIDPRNEVILEGYKRELVLIRDRIAKMEERAAR